MIDTVYVLVDKQRQNWWTGTGFIRIAEGDPNEARDVAQFRSLRAAEEAATQVRVLAEQDLDVVRVRLLMGDVIDEPATEGPRRGKHPGSARIVFTQNGT